MTAYNLSENDSIFCGLSASNITQLTRPYVLDGVNFYGGKVYSSIHNYI